MRTLVVIVAAHHEIDLSRLPASRAAASSSSWQAYAPTRDTCFDPYVNAWAGVKHLSTLEQGRLRDACKLVQGVPDDVQRTEHL